MRKRAMLGPLVGAAGMISVLTLSSRVAGFIRWFAQSAWVGTGAFANAYSSANQIPNVLYEVVAGGALSGMTIPLLARPIARKLNDEVEATSSALATWALIILTPLALIVWAASPAIVSLLPTPQGVDQALQVALMTTFLRIFAVQIPLYGVCVVLTGVLQAHEKFFAPALAPLVSSLIVIATYGIFGAMTAGVHDPGRVADSAVRVLGWGTTAGVAGMCLPLIVATWRLGIRLRPRVKLPGDEARHALRLGGAGMGALLAQQVAVVVVLFVSRRFGGEGTLPIYQYSQAVYMLPYAVLGVPVATAVFPRLAGSIHSPDKSRFTQILSWSTTLVTVIGVLSAGLLFTQAYPAQAVFTLINPVPGMAEGLIAMAPGLIGFILIFHVTRTLYALDRGGAVVKASSLAWIGVSIVSWVGAAVWSTSSRAVGTMIGLGVGQSVGMLVGGGVLLGMLVAVTGRGALTGLGKRAAITLALTVVASAIAWVGEKAVLAHLGGLGGALVASVIGICCIAAVAAGTALPLLRAMKE